MLEFQLTDEYRVRNIFFKDIDVTMDYSGSFDKDEVVHHLTTKKGFRVQGCTTERGQNNYSGLTKLAITALVTTQYKIYNKTVQMLESMSVREMVGQRWKDWVCQKNTLLAKARNLAKDRGLNRAEVTFYCVNKVPGDSFTEDLTVWSL